MAPSARSIKFKKPAAFLLGLSALGILYLTGGRQYVMQRQMEKFETEAKEIWRLRQLSQEKKDDGGSSME